jgi:hypothetical protein
MILHCLLVKICTFQLDVIELHECILGVYHNIIIEEVTSFNFRHTAYRASFGSFFTRLSFEMPSCLLRDHDIPICVPAYKRIPRYPA